MKMFYGSSWGGGGCFVRTVQITGVTILTPILLFRRTRARIR